ncbi:CARDB domain-containing protein [Nocardioides ferulae]|uniref:CARDB domain-containing protein n=1 Tax=Nocardioides ferulae TaxID=2340821 RepID=UPI000EAF6671|nr:CARDB domain-containing protein [Nocardioides ferulae]
MTTTRAGRRAARTGGVLALLLGLTAATAALTAPQSTAAPAKRPNLAVQTVTGVPEAIEKGGRFAVGAFVVNQGEGTAPPTRLTAYLSRDRKQSAGDAVVGHAPLVRMPRFSVRDKTVRVAVPSSASGVYHVLVCADATRKVAESSERDNCGFSAGRVRILEPLAGELSGTLQLTDAGELGDSMFQHTWDRTGQLDLSLAVRGREGDLPSMAVTDTGSTYDVAGVWDTLFDTEECTVTTHRDEAGSGAFEDGGGNALVASFRDPGLERLNVAVVFGYGSTITQDLCEGGDTWEETAAGGVDLRLVQESRTGRRITYRVASFTGSPAETGPWDTVSGTVTLLLDD